MEWKQLLSIGDAGQNPVRSSFERDYDRIVFSHPFRSLQDKTQVFPLPEHHFVHTRLTHSLEVSSVGRSLGKQVGELVIRKYSELNSQNISSSDFGAIVAAAALSHDIGNPPFGHTGETAISEFFGKSERGLFFKDKVSDKEWKDLLSFEGNAQGLRVLTKNTHGLRLSAPTLGAFCKYPREASIENPDKARCSHKKFGFYQSEKDLFLQITEAVGLQNDQSQESAVFRRHPLVFLVEAADDICYNIIDLEDACRIGLVSYEKTLSLFEAILPGINHDKLNKMPDPNDRISLLRAMIIGQLIQECCAVFEQEEESILNATFDTPLIDKTPSAKALKEVKTFSFEHIYQCKPVLEMEVTGFEAIEGILDAFCHAAYHKVFDPSALSKKQKTLIKLLPISYQKEIDEATSPYLLLRVVLDYISGLTDGYAVSLYRKIKGISLSSHR